jgi:hypothetical protein
VFFTPLFYWLVMTLFGRGRKDASPGAPPAAHGDDGHRGAQHEDPRAASPGHGATS